MILADLLEEVARARLTLILGDSDTGKTSLAACLAGALAAGGVTVGVLDADIGQSEVGPPTTVGLGAVRGPIARLGDADVVTLSFVGATSPALDVRATLAAVRGLAAIARERFERVLVDTSGLVAGTLGRALKRAKIRQLGPDLVLCLQRDRECEHVLDGFDAGGARIIRLAATLGVRRRTQAERRLHRTRALDRYFSDGYELRVPLARLASRKGARASEVDPADLEGYLVGLEDADGRTLGVGWIGAVAGAEARVTIPLPVPGDQVASVRLGRAKYER